MPQIKPVTRKTDIVVQESGTEILIYDLNKNKAFCLNEPAAAVWQLSNGQKTVTEIAEELAAKFSLRINEEFVWLALRQFTNERLIEDKSGIGDHFAGVSRREMIRRVGLATSAALPLVSSLIVPTSASAQSSTCSGTCQCPNSTVSFCSPTVGAAVYPLCQFNIPTSTCRCRGPFGPDGSGTSSTQKLGNCATL